MTTKKNNGKGSLVKRLRGAKEKIAKLMEKSLYVLQEETSFYPKKIVEQEVKAIRTLYDQQKLFEILGLSYPPDPKSYAALHLYLCRESGVTVDDLPF